MDIDSLKVSHHCKIRWLQRQKEIDQSDLASYLTLHEDKITQDIKESFMHSENVYRGQLNDNITASYYLQQDNVFVFSEEGNMIITYYKVDYGMPYGLDIQLMDGLISALEQSQKDLEQVKNEAGVKNKQGKNALANVNSQIKGNENQHTLLMQKKKDILAELDKNDTNVKLANEQVKSVAEKLLHSNSFFEAMADLKDDKKTN